MLNNEWLLDRLSIQSTVFHAGKYCGSWKNSIADSGQASYHIVLSGSCWLHQPSLLTPIALHAGDMVFILQDCPFVLSAHADTKVAMQAPVQEMQSIGSEETGTALTCGLITFNSIICQVILSFLPAVILFKKEDDQSGSVKKLVEIISQEASREELTSAKLMSTLTELLFTLVIRQYLERHPVDGATLDCFKLTPEFLNLVAEIVLYPSRPWTVTSMASTVGMSRSWFVQRFNEVSPLSPADMVRQIRITLACQHITNGLSLTQSAERVGYQSQAAFNRAFHRVKGITPGRFAQQCQTAHLI